MADNEWRDIHAQIEAKRGDADYLILSIGARGPNLDCPEGNAVATVRMGNDEATAEALYLEDAILLARGKIIRAREAKKAAAAKAKGG